MYTPTHTNSFTICVVQMLTLAQAVAIVRVCTHSNMCDCVCVCLIVRVFVCVCVRVCVCLRTECGSAGEPPGFCRTKSRVRIVAGQTPRRLDAIREYQ